MPHTAIKPSRPIRDNKFFRSFCPPSKRKKLIRTASVATQTQEELVNKPKHPTVTTSKYHTHHLPKLPRISSLCGSQPLSSPISQPSGSSFSNPSEFSTFANNSAIFPLQTSKSHLEPVGIANAGFFC